MKTYLQRADALTMTAAADVLSGAGVLIGDLFGVAIGDAVSGAPVVLNLDGVVGLNKAAGTINPGVRVFWDNATKRVTTTAAGNRPIGFHAGSAANSAAADTQILVLLAPGPAVTA